MRDEDKPPSAVATWSWFGWFWGLIIGSIVVISGIGIAAWAFNTGTSGVRGKANVIQQNNDGTNQIVQQAAFNKLYGDIQSDRANIQVAASDATAHPDDAYLASVLTADREHCQNDVNTYNGYTQDTTMKDWRPSNLPDNIDATTTCEVQK